MDLTFLSSSRAGERPRSIGPGSTSTPIEESFADLMQADPHESTPPDDRNRSTAPSEEAQAPDADGDAETPRAEDDPQTPDDQSADERPVENQTGDDPADGCQTDDDQTDDYQAVTPESTRPAANDQRPPAGAGPSEAAPGTEQPHAVGTQAGAKKETALPAGTTGAPGTAGAESDVSDPTHATLPEANRATRAATPGATDGVASSPVAAESTAAAQVSVAAAALAEPAASIEIAPESAAHEFRAAAAKATGKPRADKASSASRAAAAAQANGGGANPAVPDAASDAARAALPNLAAAIQDAAHRDQPQPPTATDQTPVHDRRDAGEMTARGERGVTLTERFSDHMFARGPTASNLAPELSQADQMRLVQRVARAMEAAPQRGGLLRLRLRPPELGAIRLEVSVTDGQLSARIEAETAAAQTLLLEHLPQLRERLMEHGLHVERFDVDVAQQQSADTPFQSHDPDEGWSAGFVRRRAAEPDRAAVESSPSPGTPLRAAPGQLNVIV